MKLPFEKELPEEADFRPESCPPLVVNSETVGELERIARLRGCAVSTLLLASFYVLLSRLTSSSQLSLGVYFDGRNYDELRTALGLFARFLPVGATLGPELRFTQLLASLSDSLREAERWQEFYMPPETGRAEEATPFCFEYVEEARPTARVADRLRLTLLSASAYIGRFKALLRCLRRGDGTMVAEWRYDAGRYGEEEIRRLAERWEAALRSVAGREGELRLEEVGVVGEGELAELRRRNRGEERRWEGAKSVHELFAEQAEARPEAVAVVYEGESVTYRRLNESANQLARYLRREGVRAEERVGLMVERSVEMVVGMLGILKAGGAYVPLEKSQPAGRLARMVEDAGVRVVVSVESLRGKAEEAGAEVSVCLDGEGAKEIARESEGGMEAGVEEANAAYVIYTSGSTGSPKGVCVEHRQLINYLNSILQRLRLPSGASFALVSTFAADLGNTVIFPSLCAGGTLHVISPERSSDAAALAEYFRDKPVDCLKIVPSHLSALLTHSEPELVLPRRCLTLGGEASNWRLIERVRSLAPECRILNHYGPTETTVGVLTYAFGQGAAGCEGQTAPLGHPIANTQVYALDPHLRPAPIGAPGELHIGGSNLARGYLNSPEMTAAKFIPNPFGKEQGERIYKTGDLARHLPDGSVEFLGRADDQVKVRGFRIEPGEIEAVLRRHEGVEQIKVLARETPAGDKRLVAYLVPDEHCARTVRQLLRLEKEGRLNRQQWHELPNGMLIAGQNRNETDFTYREIFEQKIYLRRGVELKDGDCVLDVGANIGMFSLFVSRMCKDANIYAFEPIPPLYELLRINATLYGLDAKLFKCGVAAETAPQEFTYYPRLTLMSGRFADLTKDREVVKLFESNRRGPEETAAWDDDLLDEALAERMTSENFLCEMKRISDVIRENRIERIDLLKIDVQKSELEVIMGIDETDWPKIEQVVLEAHDIDGRLHQIVSLLEARGFQVAVQQEAMLKETALYDLYCVRPERARNLPGRGGERKASGGLPRWTNPDSLIDDVRTYSKGNLPDHMVPSAFVLLPAMPLTPNGKIDRKSLPEPVEAGAETCRTFVAPRNQTEGLLAEIWRQTLGAPRVGVHDNFFELGGDSILSIQIVARANQCGLKLSPKLIFRHQTIAELCEAISEAGARQEVGETAEQGLLTGAAPLTPIQRYFFEQPLEERRHFNQSLLLKLRRRIEAEDLQRVVRALVEHHDALRLRFRQGERGWEQSYGGAEAVGEAAVEVVDLSGQRGEGQGAWIEAASDEAQRSLRLGEGGLLRVKLFETGEEQRLLMVAHHLVMDGVSWRILLEDLERGLGQAERGEKVEFGRKTSSYRQWAERLERYARSEEASAELEYWSEVARWRGGKLPVDFPDGENTVESARTVSVSLDAEETRALLQEAPEVHRTQINDALLTALAEALGRWSGRRQALVDVEGHGREELWGDVDLSRTVGWFTTLFPVVIEIGAATQGGALLKHVKEQLRRAPNRGIGFSLLRYLSESAEISRKMRALPQPEVRFNYLGQLDNVLPANSLFGPCKEATGAERAGKQRRAYLLDVTSMVSEGRLRINVIYSENAHRRAAIEGLSRDLVRALRSIISHCRSMESGDFSPSDFPLAKLSQQQLDRIMSKTVRGQRAVPD